MENVYRRECEFESESSNSFLDLYAFRLLLQMNLKLVITVSGQR
jgi:hypothetical protein